MPCIPVRRYFISTSPHHVRNALAETGTTDSNARELDLESQLPDDVLFQTLKKASKSDGMEEDCNRSWLHWFQQQQQQAADPSSTLSTLKNTKRSPASSRQKNEPTFDLDQELRAAARYLNAHPFLKEQHILDKDTSYASSLASHPTPSSSERLLSTMRDQAAFERVSRLIRGMAMGRGGNGSGHGASARETGTRVGVRGRISHLFNTVSPGHQRREEAGDAAVKAVEMDAKKREWISDNRTWCCHYNFYYYSV